MEFIIFFGANGGGKGAQASKFSQRWQVPHVESGAIFREAMQSGSGTKLQIRESHNKKW